MKDAITAIGKSRIFVRIAEGCHALLGINGINITAWKMISNGAIFFEEIMFEKGGTCQLEEVIIREIKGTGSLQKANMLLLFFKSCDIVAVTGSDFAWTSNTTINELVGAVEIASADYRELASNGSVDSAIAFKVLSTPFPLVASEDYQRIFCIPVGLGLSTYNYTENSELDIELVINQD